MLFDISDYLLIQGQDLYQSKQVRDKQIARVLGKVWLFNLLSFFLALCLNLDGSIIISCRVASCIAIQLKFGSMPAAIGLHCTDLASSH